MDLQPLFISGWKQLSVYNQNIINEIGIMSQSSESNNKRIAKNTLLLFFRMLIMMAVLLYTSRVIQNALGVVDFGVY